MPKLNGSPPSSPAKDRTDPAGTRYRAARNRRRVLCVSPRFAHSFATLDHALPLVRAQALMPPQGLLVLAAYLPPEWEVRFVDENMRPVTASEFEWADVVFLSGMHVQREYICAINHRAHAFNKLTALGGPSVSSCPEWYDEVDLLHIGELGDGTDALLARLDQSVTRPDRQETFTTRERLPLADFPIPAYHLVKLRHYVAGSVQFSSGCPYVCEFCDIPELYGRNPRLKTPRQLTRELDAMLAQFKPHAVYFVDDNFIGNRRATRALLQELVRWQQEHNYPFLFSCEATLNLAQEPELLELMREARFITVFYGIESPEEATLKHMHKEQNLRQPIVEAVRTTNRYGVEAWGGIIFGFDTDTLETGERMAAFIEESKVPFFTINILQALPRTPLWRRLEAAGRLRKEDPSRDSNVEFLLPYEVVVEMWRTCVLRLYAPDAIYDRLDHQLRHTYPNRKAVSLSRSSLSWAEVWYGLGVLGAVFWHVSVRSHYRRRFWRTAWAALRQGRVQELVALAMQAHHMILYATECARDEVLKSNYCPRPEALNKGTGNEVHL